MTNPQYSIRASQSSPLELMIDPYFWRKNWMIILVLLASVFVFAILWEFTMPNTATDSTISYLSIIIYLIAGWGLWKALFYVSKMEIEYEYCQQIENNALEKIRLIRGDNLLMNITELPSLLPDNPKSISSRLFDHIITEANARKFESNLVTLQPYKEESYGSIIEISNLQRIALLTGILGTFLGLIMAFRGLNIENLEIAPITNALEFSFGTSIAGLETAIVLGALILFIRQKQEKLFHMMEKASDSLLTLGRSALNKDKISLEFDQLGSTVNQLNLTVENQNQEVRAQTAQIMTGIDRLAEARENFNGFLNDFSKQEQQFMKEVKDIYNHLSPEVIGKELQKNLGRSVDLMSNSLNDNLEDVLKKYEELHTYIIALNENLAEIKKSYEAQVSTSSEVVLKSREEIFDVVEKLMKSQADFLAQVSDAHLSEQIKESILKAGGDIAKQYNKDLKKVLPHLQNLEKQIGSYNRIVEDEITSRTPPKIALQILNLSGKFITSLFTGAIGGVKFIIRKIKNEK